MVIESTALLQNTVQKLGKRDLPLTLRTTTPSYHLQKPFLTSANCTLKCPHHQIYEERIMCADISFNILPVEVECFVFGKLGSGSDCTD